MTLSAANLITLMEPVALLLLGEPNRRLSKKGELRFGAYGSVSCDLKTGTWFDHEANDGGGVLDLIEQKTGARGAERFDWLELHNLWTNDQAKPTGKHRGGLGREVAHYDYTDEVGNLLYQVVRFEPKTFRQRRPNGAGGWTWKLEDVRQVPYRLPELIEAIASDQLVLIVEGEKDADNLWSIGIPATTNAMGVGKWNDGLSQHFRGAHVVVLNDNDQAGRKHIDAVAAKLIGMASRVRRLDLADHWPNMPDKSDVSDWLAQGHSREELDQLIERAPDYQATKQQAARTATLEALKTMTFAPIKHVIPGIIVEGLTLFAGKPKIGKSWLLLHAGIAVARSGFTLGDIHCAEGDVLYCALEDNERRLQSRATKLLGIAQDWPARFSYTCEMPRLANGGLDVIKGWIKSKAHPRLIIIDTLAMVRAPKKRDESSYDADYAAVLELRALASETSVAIVLVHHLRKADSDDAFDTVSGTLGLTGAPDSVLVLKRDTMGTIVLHGRGRDLTEIEKALTFDREACLWRVTGDAADVQRSSERGAVLAAIDEAGEPIGPNEIAIAIGARAGNVRFLLHKLQKEGDIEKVAYGKYRIKPRVVA
jgi:hypothetical protein